MRAAYPHNGAYGVILEDEEFDSQNPLHVAAATAGVIFIAQQLSFDIDPQPEELQIRPARPAKRVTRARTEG